jgi:hypothetical protein
MPILNDIMDHGVIGPAIRQGRREGKIEGAAAIAQRQLTARFGPLSFTTKKRLAQLTLPELEDLAIHLLTAKGIRDLFPR